MSLLCCIGTQTKDSYNVAYPWGEHNIYNEQLHNMQMNATIVKNYSHRLVSIPSTNMEILLRKLDSAVGGNISMDFLFQQKRKAENFNKLLQISSFVENWNGYNAKPFPQSLILKCQDILNNLSFQPKLFPTGRESIQLEYELSNGRYLEFEVYSDNIWALYIDEKGNEQEFPINNDFEFMNKVVMRFHEQ